MCGALLLITSLLGFPVSRYSLTSSSGVTGVTRLGEHAMDLQAYLLLPAVAAMATATNRHASIFNLEPHVLSLVGSASLLNVGTAITNQPQLDFWAPLALFAQPHIALTISGCVYTRVPEPKRFKLETISLTTS